MTYMTYKNAHRALEELRRLHKWSAIRIAFELAQSGTSGGIPAYPGADWPETEASTDYVCCTLVALSQEYHPSRSGLPERPFVSGQIGLDAVGITINPASRSVPASHSVTANPANSGSGSARPGELTPPLRPERHRSCEVLTAHDQ